MTRLHLSCVKPGEWPSRDRKLWLAAQERGNVFEDDGGRAADWRPATIRSVEQGYGFYLAWLSQISLDTDAAPIDRVDQDRIKFFIGAYAPGRAEYTVAAAVHGIAYLLRATYKPDGLPWLTRLAHRMMNEATPSRPKLPRMASVSELDRLGWRLMDEGVERLQDRKVSGAQIYRDGLMIASLAMRPLRRRNLSTLRLGHSLLRDHAGYRVQFRSKETKKGFRIDFHYPDWLTEPFDIYVGDVRPILLTRAQQKDEGWLWIGRRGRPLPPNNVTATVTNTTMRHLKRPVSPHLFRDCTATDVALLDPQHVGITKSLLGHTTLASSQKHYNQATSFSAIKRLDAVLSSLRED